MLFTRTQENVPDIVLQQKSQPATDYASILDGVVEQCAHIILGKERAIRLAVACLVARGHLLIEDIPGVGKTTLAHALAGALGLNFQRIQFTSDMLPADILGVSVYQRETATFSFHKGPIFSQLILADEINRATPKTQSALLEAMEEHQVTLEGKTRALPEPFFVIATQNPTHQIGTFPLPESQLDRFNMRIQLGYPGADAERRLLKGKDRRELLDTMVPGTDIEMLTEIQAAVAKVHVAEPLLDYLQDLLNFSRSSAEFRTGLSPRAGLAILRTARAWALMHGRDSVVPEDIQTILPGVVAHRLVPVGDTDVLTSDAVAHRLIDQVPIP